MEQEPNFTKGFNDGYKLAKFSPELFEKLKDSLSAEKEYDSGILAGAEQWQKEKENVRIKELEDLEKDKEKQGELERE